MSSLTPFGNRLQKNFRHWRKWARRRDITCYRVYDRDIPEFPLAIDWYDGRVHVQTFASPGADPTQLEKAQQQILAQLIAEILEVPSDLLSFKLRRQQKGLAQYQRRGSQTDGFVVLEAGLHFLVNLEDYLDTGLFLDHRQTRGMVRDKSQGRRCLNLFSYTGSFSVYAAAGGAETTLSVDLSGTYQRWSQQNFQLNNMQPGRHRLENIDVFRYLEQAGRRGEQFELIVLDPPSFSNSKKMRSILDLQRDHPTLIRSCLQLLTRGGELIFSTNLRRFTLDPWLSGEASIKEISQQTVPADFRRHRPHRCWLIKPE